MVAQNVDRLFGGDRSRTAVPDQARLEALPDERLRGASIERVDPLNLARLDHGPAEQLLRVTLEARLAFALLSHSRPVVTERPELARIAARRECGLRQRPPDRTSVGHR